MTVDLRHNVVAGFKRGFPDFIAARPDTSTLAAVPWEPACAICICDLFDAVTGEPSPLDPRGALRRTLAAYAARGLAPIVAPRARVLPLRSPIRRRRPATGRMRAADSPVYTVGYLADPRGVLSTMLDAAGGLGLGTRAAAHEYGRSQLRDQPLARRGVRRRRPRSALQNAGQGARRLREGLLATFMGKPFNGDEGSGLHMRVSLQDGDEVNACADADAEDGLALARHFIGGVMEHAAGDDGDPRSDGERLPPAARGGARAHACVLGARSSDDARSRPARAWRCDADETRVGDGTANSSWQARWYTPPASMGSRASWSRRRRSRASCTTSRRMSGAPLPTSFADALAALEADPVLRDALGGPLIETFKTIKEYEFERFQDLG